MATVMLLPGHWSPSINGMQWSTLGCLARSYDEFASHIIDAISRTRETLPVLRLQIPHARRGFQKAAVVLTRILAAWCVSPALATPAVQKFSAILEIQVRFYALFRVSPDSGDLVGHVFLNDSKVGRQILQGCLAGMSRVLDVVRSRDLDGAAGERPGLTDMYSAQDSARAIANLWGLSGQEVLFDERAVRGRGVGLDSGGGRNKVQGSTPSAWAIRPMFSRATFQVERSTPET